MAMNLLKIS